MGGPDTLMRDIQFTEWLLMLDRHSLTRPDKLLFLLLCTLELISSSLFFGGAYATELSLAQVKGRYSSSTLFIEVKYETLEGNIPIQGCKSGTGVLISRNGFVATSYHLFTDENGREFDKIVSVRAKIGESFECDEQASDVLKLDRITELKPFDAALLKMRSQKDFKSVESCVGPVIPDGDTLHVLGFPLGKLLSSKSVSKDGATSKMWQVSGKFDDGASGGPVFSTHGNFVALVHGTFKNTEVSYVVPVDYFSTFFNSAGIVLRQCSSRGDASSPPDPTPRPIQAVPSVSMGLPEIVHSPHVPNPAGVANAPGLQIRVPGRISNAAGKKLQLVAKFGYLNGQPIFASASERQFRDVGGFVATGTQPSAVASNSEDLNTSIITIPYYALNFPPTNYAAQINLALWVKAYLDGQVISQSAAVPFTFRW